METTTVETAMEDDENVLMGNGAIPTETAAEVEESDPASPLPQQEDEVAVVEPREEVESSSADEAMESKPAIQNEQKEVTKESEPQPEAEGSSSSSSAETDIVLALMGWCRAWNNNNVDEYLEAYDPNATYISESLLRAKVTKDDIVLRGKTSINKLFRKVFGSGETTLRYSQIQVELMGTRHASVFGRFTLTMKNNKVADAGVFTLCLVKTEYGVWKIQSEHSSSSLAPLKKK